MTGTADRPGGSAERPVVACYCATFLKPEMLHIYRQITALERVRPIVVAQKREEADRFPFDALTVLPKARTHFLRRIWFRQLRDVPWQISHSETTRLLAVLAAQRAELLHIYLGHIAVHLLPLIARWNGPSVVSFHGADVMVELEKPAYRSATLRMLAAVRLVLVRSESLRAALVALGCAADKIRVQRTGIPLHEFPFRERTPPTEGSWRLLQAGRLIEKKGLRTTLRAFAAFARDYPNARLTIAGEGPLLDALRQLAGELQIAERVVFAGFKAQAELRELFYESHIFLHPSETGADGNQEGVPNSMLEAMASGLPVVSTRSVGVVDCLTHDVDGLLHEPGDVAGLHVLLEQALSDGALRTRLATAALEQVRTRYSWPVLARSIDAVYGELAGTAPDLAWQPPAAVDPSCRFRAAAHLL